MKKLYSKLFFGVLGLLCSLMSFAQVSVTATSGTTGPTTYATLKAACDAINAGTHKGTVTVSITGNTTENAMSAIFNSGTGAASYTSVTIKPAAGVTPTITGNVAGPVLAIFGSNVTVDGSNNGSTTRNLTITNTDTSSNHLSVIGVFSSGTTTLNNIAIKNTVLQKGFTGILVFNDSITTGGYFTNLAIQNNSVQQTIYGIYVAAAKVAGNGNGTSISNNDLTASGASAVYNTGIFTQGVDGGTVSGNTIANFNTQEDEDDIGIFLGPGVKNTVVEKNVITNLKYTGNQGYGAQGIFVYTGVANANIRIANNMIAGISGDGWDYTSQYVTDNPIGIALLTSTTYPTQSGISIVFNSINLTGNTLNNDKALSMGIYMRTGTTATITNNIIVNNLGIVTNSTAIGSVGIYATGTTSQFASINYNDYYVSPSGSGGKFLGAVGTTFASTLGSLQTATGGDVNSKNILPVFVSATDLHLVPASNTALDNLGTPVTGVTTDIDGEARSAATPDMGADEFSSSTVCIAPAITTQPAAQTLCAGGTTTFSVVASGTNLAYQWRLNGSNIINANAATYTINNTTASAAGNYDVVVSNTCGTATSSAVALTVNAAPTITTQPAGLALCTAANGTLTVAATGTGTLTYQWKKDGTDIANATSASYTITGATAANAGSYTVVVSNGTCSVTSAPAAVTVGAGATITTQPAAQTVCSGGNATFSVVASGTGLTYQWRKGGTNITGATSASYTITGATAANAGNYDVVVTSTCGNVTSNVVALTINAATAIATQPAAQSVCANTAASFTVAATGTNLTYQWRKNGANIQGATSATYTINSTVAGDAANYDVVVTGTCGAVTSNPVMLAVNTCTAVPVVDADVTSAVLMPNVVRSQTVLRLTVKKAMKIDWTITDANGKVVRAFSKAAAAGRNDINLALEGLSAGTYLITGSTINGRTEVLRFVKL